MTMSTEIIAFVNGRLTLCIRVEELYILRV